MRRDGLQHHLTEAIALNRARRAFYARKTGGRSRRLSNVLIGAELALLPVAWFVDRWAGCFHREGIPVVADDFASMRKVRPSTAPPRFRKRMTAEQRRRVADTLKAWRQLLWKGDLHTACHASQVVLRVLKQRETRWQVHLALSRHLVESAGYVALHGAAYAQRSDGATRGLTGALVRGHAALAPWAARLDHEAQRSHRQGAGIVINDMPAIPFFEEGPGTAAAT